MIKVELAERLRHLPPYLFAEIDRLKQEQLRKGVDVIDLSIGDPDMPTPGHIVDALKKAAQEPKNHRYPSYEGMPAFRQAVADWYKRRFGVSLDAQTEVLSLIGSKEGIGHIPLAFAGPGDAVLYSSPGYPVYPVSALFAGAEGYPMPLLEKNGFLPDLESIPADVLKRAKLMFVNYPNNPTSAVAGKGFFRKVVDFAGRHNIIVCHDAAYSEIYYNGKRPESYLETPGAKQAGIEFHSLSKTYNMTGWRIGFAVGNRDVIAGLGKIKTNLDSGVFQAVQEAGITALETGDGELSGIRETYQQRRDALYSGLRRLGFQVMKPEATFYLWASCPAEYRNDSRAFAKLLLEKAGIVATPGVGFGAAGEGYIRFALTVPVSRTEEAVERIGKSL
ncbi:MAG: LL-diaminopimelate aminotransferase [Nitrospiraceae bacterium]|nr:LL-diaminopimelate aminotransferase [Nitrospiraceae bacterium]